MNKLLKIITLSTVLILILFWTAKSQTNFLLLATKKTSTMQKEMREAADNGYRFADITGGKTSFGGSEVVVIMTSDANSIKGQYEYKLLATKKTSTMQKEMQEAGDNGFKYRGQAVFDTSFGGDEVVVIMERDTKAEPVKIEYKLLATKKTSTMQKELNEASEAGFMFVGVSVGETSFGGDEVVVILQRIAGKL